MSLRTTTIAVLIATFVGIARAQTPDEIAAMLDKSKIKLADAIAKAQAAVKDGVLSDAEVEARAHRIDYEAEFHMDGGGLKRVKINAETGELVEVADKELPDDLKDQLRERGAAIREAAANAKFDVAAAIVAAEEKAGGRTYELKLKERDGHLIFDVRMIAEGKLREALIDAESNAVLRLQDRKEK